MKNAKRFGFVVTHADEWGRLIDMPWLENEYWINERDRIVLAVNDWRAIADGDGRIWDAWRYLATGGPPHRPTHTLDPASGPGNGTVDGRGRVASGRARPR